MQSGVFGPAGLADVRLPLPRSVPAGARLWTRALLGASLTPFQVVTVQEWAGPEHDARR